MSETANSPELSDDEARAAAEMAEVTSATRTMFSKIVRQLTLSYLAIAAIGAGGGYLLDGMRGVWGALLALAIAAFFMLTTVLVMYWTAARHVFLSGAATMGAWIVKMIVMLFVLFAVGGRDFYHPGVFLATLAAVIIISSVIEMRAIATARIPYVQPGLHRPRRG